MLMSYIVNNKSMLLAFLSIIGIGAMFTVIMPTMDKKANNIDLLLTI